MKVHQLVYRAIKTIRAEGLRTFVSQAVSFFCSNISNQIDRLQKRYWQVQYGIAAPSPTELIYVDPTEIKRMATGHRPFSSKGTAIVGGDWDRNYISREFASERELRECINKPGVAPLKQYAFFKAVTDHFEQGTPWDETRFYQHKRQKDTEGYYGTEEKLERRFAEIDRLYESMQTDGYKSQRELQDDNPEAVPLGKQTKSPPERGEVAVAIARDGEILHVDGRHRLSVAQFLGVSEIPVRVVARHTEWQQLRAQVATADDPKSILAAVGVSISHPDLCNFAD